jgi:hypothetical protein
MRTAASFCLLAATVLSVTVLGGCSSSRRGVVRTQPRAATAYQMAPARSAPARTVRPSETIHERVVTSYEAPAAPALPDEATFVPAARPSRVRGMSDGAVTSAPCDPCARPAPTCCPPRIPNPFCRTTCCPPSG